MHGLAAAGVISSRPKIRATDFSLMREQTEPFPAATAPLLEAVALTKAFDGNTVLSGVDLALRAGEVHAVVGENGAGKSTLIKILGGVYQPDAGTIRLLGAPCRLNSPREAIARGIVVIHQELSLATHLSIQENIFLGHFPVTPFGVVDRKEMGRRSRVLLERLGVDLDPNTPVGRLSIAQQQMVEIAKALSLEANVLVLDEPTAVLDRDQVAILFNVIRRLRGEGLGLVYISHHLEEIFAIADRVSVLRDGRRTGESAVADVTQDWIVERMIGRGQAAGVPIARKHGPVVLELHELSCTGVFEGISFAIHAGEVVGMAGLTGAGRTEVARAVIGMPPPDRGSIRVGGQQIRIPNPRVAGQLGIVYVSEDRKTQGLLANRSVRENATIQGLGQFARAGFLRPRRERQFVARMIERLDIRLSTMEAPIRTLSGGNQQKVLIGRALAVRPRILIFDEPTRGVDVGAKEQIYSLIEQLAADGAAVLLISSELQEILRLSDRIVVLRRGRIAAVLPREHATEAAIMRAAVVAEAGHAC